MALKHVHHLDGPLPEFELNVATIDHDVTTISVPMLHPETK